MRGFSLAKFLLLVHSTGRIFRDGQVATPAELTGILDRLATSAECWHARLETESRLAC